MSFYKLGSNRKTNPHIIKTERFMVLNCTKIDVLKSQRKNASEMYYFFVEFGDFPKSLHISQKTRDFLYCTFACQ